MAKAGVDYCYERRESPFLALTRGTFHFLHTSQDRKTEVAVRQLSLSPLGTLAVPSGRLVAADPFQNLRSKGNAWLSVPPGHYTVIQTIAQVGEDSRMAASRTAYLSLVFDLERLGKRQQEQQKTLFEGRNPSLPSTRLLPLTPELPDFDFSEAEAMELTRAGIPILTGCLSVADNEALERRMPPDEPLEARGWLEVLFEHGVEGSWFDAIDSSAPWPKGCANLLLPGGDPEETVVLCQTGWGDGRYDVLLEVDADLHPLAIHFDFQVIPRDPLH